MLFAVKISVRSELVSERHCKRHFVTTTQLFLEVNLTSNVIFLIFFNFWTLKRILILINFVMFRKQLMVRIILIPCIFKTNNPEITTTAKLKHFKSCWCV